MRAKIVQFKLQWISPFWFQSIKTQIRVHLWWSLNLCNYFEDYWCFIIKPIHFLSYRIKSDFISVDKIFLTLKLLALYFLSQVVGVRVVFLFFNCDTEKNTKAFISVSFDFYFERKGKQGRLQKRILKHDGNAGAKSAGHSIFKGKSLVSVLFLQYWKKRMDQTWFHLKNLDLNPVHTVYIQTQNALLDSRVQFWVFRKKHTLSSSPVTAAVVDYT